MSTRSQSLFRFHSSSFKRRNRFGFHILIAWEIENRSGPSRLGPFTCCSARKNARRELEGKRKRKHHEERFPSCYGFVLAHSCATHNSPAQFPCWMLGWISLLLFTIFSLFPSRFHQPQNNWKMPSSGALIKFAFSFRVKFFFWFCNFHVHRDGFSVAEWCCGFSCDDGEIISRIEMIWRWRCSLRRRCRCFSSSSAACNRFLRQSMGRLMENPFLIVIFLTAFVSLLSLRDEGREMTLICCRLSDHWLDILLLLTFWRWWRWKTHRSFISIVCFILHKVEIAIVRDAMERAGRRSWKRRWSWLKTRKSFPPEMGKKCAMQHIKGGLIIKA